MNVERVVEGELAGETVALGESPPHWQFIVYKSRMTRCGKQQWNEPTIIIIIIIIIIIVITN
jgi:hypothetical protein